jgi:hypothetical protein
MKALKSWISLILSRGRISSSFRRSRESTLLLGHQTLHEDNSHEQQLYERLKSQLLFGVTEELLGLSPDAFKGQVFRIRLSLLKLSALMQNGDFGEARALSRQVLSQGCGKEELARYLVSAMLFSQASLSFSMGHEDKAAQQYAEGLRVLQMGVDELLMTHAWLGRRKMSGFSSRLHDV